MTTMIELALVATLAEQEHLVAERPELRPVLRGAMGLNRVLLQQWDRYADDRMAEIDRMSDLFVRSREIVPAELAGEIDAALASTNSGLAEGLCLSNLDAIVDGLNHTLIRLHAWTELDDGKAAKSCKSQIYLILDQMADARFISGGLW